MKPSALLAVFSGGGGWLLRCRKQKTEWLCVRVRIALSLLQPSLPYRDTLSLRLLLASIRLCLSDAVDPVGTVRFTKASRGSFTTSSVV
ncbi:hypothetical protein GJAV_G00244710 [Gymnothorax javanicus]|nr:hypothetical protein GJAV_G00244710 [Gymnothorax javanicus]